MIQKHSAAGLVLKTYKGGSPGAIHWYGTIYHRFRTPSDLCDVRVECELHRKMGTKEARFLNKKDECNMWKAGSLTTRFESREAVIEQAKEEWKHIALNATLLLVGNTCNVGIREPIDGPPEIMPELTNLFQQFDEAGGWDNETLANTLEKRWIEIVGNI